MLSFSLIPLSNPLHIFSVEQCTAGTLPEERKALDPPAGLEALYREQERRKRVLGWHHTHRDPFEGEWEQIFSWLQANPELQVIGEQILRLTQETNEFLTA